MHDLSIIIPILNEKHQLIKQMPLLSSLCDQGYELVIVDGGSTDGSLIEIEKLRCKCLHVKASRGFQLHTGAKHSTNSVLLFLHIDTCITLQHLDDIFRTLLSSNKHWGRFNVSFANKKFIFSIIAWFMNKRSCLTGIATGDQAIFIKREAYFECGGFSDIPIMEDIEICKRLKKSSLPLCLSNTVTTSSRKWEQQGVVKTILLMWRLRLLYFFGVSANRLAKLYYLQ
jgi:rSAM/selenodomain-associated transferase 2